MKQLRIDKPCSENWNEFAPKPEGGFCGSCEKIVVDFTNKSNQEISDILLAKAGENLCGRIGINQLDDFNGSYTNWQSNATNKGFQSRFLCAVILSFGLTLFTSQNIKAQEILGEISYIERVSDSTIVADSSETHIIPNKTIDTLDLIMGDMMIEDPISDTTAADTSKHVINGKCPEPVKPVKIQKLNHPIIMGMMVVPTPKGTEEPNKIKPPKVTLPTPSIGHIYPNPANGITTLYLLVETSEIYSINIFNQEGKLCQIVSKNFLAEGRHEMKVDLSEFETGLYHISISSKSHKSTIQLIKT